MELTGPQCSFRSAVGLLGLKRWDTWVERGRANRNNSGADDLCVYLVRSTVPPLNGCAAQPGGRPGAARVLPAGSLEVVGLLECCRCLLLTLVPFLGVDVHGERHRRVPEDR